MWKPLYYNNKRIHYEVNECGEVRNSNNKVLLIGGFNSSGYIRVTIHLGVNQKKAMLVHRLVASAFMPKPPSSIYQINHIDGDKTNNNMNNLEWVTPKENTMHAWVHGLIQDGEHANHHVYTEKEMRHACGLLTKGYPINKIAKLTGIDKNAIKRVYRGKNWIFLYKEYNFPSPKKRKTLNHYYKFIDNLLLMNAPRQYIMGKCPDDIDKFTFNNLISNRMRELRNSITVKILRKFND